MAMQTQFDRARAELNSFVLDVAPPHYPTYNAPDTFDKLAVRNAVSGGPSQQRPMPVWSGASENTIYLSPEGNYAFRAWHDLTHLRLGALFDAEGERAVAVEHQMEAANKGLTYRARVLLWIDTWEQFAWGVENDGAFVEDQLAFARRKWAEICSL